MLGCLMPGMCSEALSVCFYLVFALIIIYDFPDAVDGICSNNTKYLSTHPKNSIKLDAATLQELSGIFNHHHFCNKKCSDCGCHFGPASGLL